MLLYQKSNPNNKHWNKSKVQAYLGHEKIDTTTHYTRDAEQLLKIAPYDWFKRILRQPKKWLEEITLKSTKPQKTLSSNGNSPDCSESSERFLIFYIFYISILNR